MKKIKNLQNQTRGAIRRFRQRDFSGNTGLAMRNSTWQIATTLTSKIGSILFIIIIARLMAPELYGLYGLALSTILLLGVFGDFGIGNALMTFISKTIDKNPGKAKGYFYYLTKYRVFLIAFSSILLVILAGWLANNYYQKPVYYALLAGAIYLPITILSGHLGSVFISRNNFRPQFIKEVIIQVSKLLIVPLLIIFFLAKNSSSENYLFWVIIAISICYGLGGIYQWVVTKRTDPFRQAKTKQLDHKEKKKIFKFILPLSITALSGIFFGYIDQIMLGHYVESQFIGFYQAAFNLITSASAIISFSAVAVFPILVRLKAKRLERGFRKARNITLSISILAALVTMAIAPFIIRIIYGGEYLPAINYLRILALLLISFPLIELHVAYYISQEKTRIISILLVASTIINIVLNYLFINIGLSYSMFYAVTGACIATVISRYIYLGGLIFVKGRKKKKLRSPPAPLPK
jgi:O-antigen/teichoic acid export membrane protein